MKDKKILIASWTYYPAWSYGGIARVMRDLSKEMVKDTYQVDAITTDVFDNYSRYEKESDLVDGVRIFYFKNNSNRIANKLKMPLPQGLSCWLDVNIKQYDVVHIGDFRNLFNYTVYKYCKKYNIPYIVSPFGTISYKKDFRGIIKWLFDKTWSKTFLKQAKNISVQTQSEYQDAIDFGINKNNITLVPLMVEYEKFLSLPAKGAMRRKYDISDTAKVLLFVGRIHKYKATDMMIQVFFDYQKIITDSFLIIIGRDDGYESVLKKMVKDLGLEKKVLFVGAIYYPESLSYYVDSDIYFMAPSHWEATSTASLEALASGTPVIVTEQADIPFINDFDAGKVLKYDKEVLLQGLLSIKDKNSLSCKHLIKEHFDVKSIKDSFLELYFG